MRYMRRIHLSDSGWKKSGWWHGSTLDLSNPRTGEWAHSLLKLSNGGGKTTLLALVFSTLDTPKKHFMRTQDSTNYHFDDYFEGRPAFIVIEWYLPKEENDTESLGGLITGQLVVPLRDSIKGRMTRRYFFAFRTRKGLTMESIPSRGLEGYKEENRLNGISDATNWLQTMRTQHKGFYSTENQAEWKTKLTEEGIDTKIVESQVKLNVSEGGFGDFLKPDRHAKTAKEDAFLLRFMDLTLAGEYPSQARETVRNHVAKLGMRPKYKKVWDGLRLLRGKHGEFANACSDYFAAKKDMAEKIMRALSVEAALDQRGNQSSKLLNGYESAATAHRQASEQAGKDKQKARRTNKAVRIEKSRRAMQAAENRQKESEETWEEAEKTRNTLAGAVALSEINGLRSERQTNQGLISKERSDLAPYKEELEQTGADLLLSIKTHLSGLEGQKEEREGSLQVVQDKKDSIDAARGKAEDLARELIRKESSLQTMTDTALDNRVRLEQEGALRKGEDAPQATARHSATAAEHKSIAEGLEKEAEEEQAKINESHTKQEQHREGKGRLASNLESLQGEADEAEEERIALCTDPVIVELTGEAYVNLEMASVAQRLGGAIAKKDKMLRDEQRRMERLNADKDSLEKYGLASIDQDVDAVVEILAEAGMRDVQPYAVYVCSMLESADDVRKAAKRDPARFAGVAVQGANALRRAKEALRRQPDLSRSVVVSETCDPLAPTATDGKGYFVLPVKTPAAYDRKAAERMLESIEKAIATSSDNAKNTSCSLDSMRKFRQRLDQWKKRYGDRRLSKLQDDIDQARGRLKKLDDEIDALGTASLDMAKVAKSKRDSARERRNQAVSFNSQENKTQEYHKHWGADLSGWREELSKLESKQADLAQQKEDLEFVSMKNDGEIKAQTRQIGSLRNELNSWSKEAGGISHDNGKGRPGGAIEDLHQQYCNQKDNYEKLTQKGLKGAIASLSDRNRTIETQISNLTGRYNESFSDIPGADIDVEIVQGNLKGRLQLADQDLGSKKDMLDKDQKNAIAKRSAHGSTVGNFSKEIDQGELLVLEKADDKELRRVLDKANTDQQRYDLLQDSERAAEEQARSDWKTENSTYQKIGNIKAELRGVLLAEEADAQARPADLPADNEIENYVKGITRSIREAREKKKDSKSAAEALHKVTDNLLRDESTHGLSENDPDIVQALKIHADFDHAAHEAKRIIEALDDRLRSARHDLDSLSKELNECRDQLEELLETALWVMSRMRNKGKIPDDVPRFRGKQVFRISAKLSERAIPKERRRELIVGYIDQLIISNTIPATGQEIAVQLIYCLVRGTGRRKLGIQILKPDSEGDVVYMPVDRITASGGEMLTAALMIYLVIARIRATFQEKNKIEGGILFIDNPLGTVTKALLLKTQVGLATAMGIQLFFATHIDDDAALGEFERIIPIAQLTTSTGETHLKVMDLKVANTYIDKRPIGPIAERRPSTVSLKPRLVRTS